MPKLYCHIDETGPDTQGKLFIVAAVNITPDRTQALTTAEQLEQKSGKGLHKWVRINDATQKRYISSLLASPIFKGCLYYSVHTDTLDYVRHTIDLAARSIKIHMPYQMKAVVRVDGLEKSQHQKFGAGLRDNDILTEKVRGVDDQSDALIRVADAVCGFVRAALKPDAIFKKQLESAEKDGFITRIE